jgi:hypothetical protein
MGRIEREDGPLYLAVLVPHRDSRKILWKQSAELFASGWGGAWSFPHVAPLALLRSPLGEAELRELARNLRRRSLEGGRGGRILTGAGRVLSLEMPGGPSQLRIYGLALELRTGPEDFGPGVAKIRALLPPLLGCAVLGGAETPPESVEGPGFRAAAAANMIYRPLPSGDRDYSFSWMIGKLHWLPRPPRRGREPGGPEER